MSKPIQHLDTTGLFCPEPIMLLHEKMDNLTTGDRLYLICTDPTAERDVARFCQFLGHHLIETVCDTNNTQKKWQFLIEKVADKQ